MRKIFAHLKSVVAFAIVAAMTLSVSCSYDDTAIKKRVDKVEKSLAELTERVNNLESQSVTLEDLLDGKAVVTKVEENEAGDTIVTLSNGESFTVLAEADALQYRTVDGVLEISADGIEWVAVTVAPECVVTSVVVNEDGSVTFTLANGTVATVGTAELIECAATRSQVYVIAGATKAIPFTINDAVEDINIMNQPFGWSASVEEYVEVEVEDDDLDMGVLAVGGTNYVLNINGPSQALVAAGLAAKEGIVSVHFNTAAGACKVMNVSVTLAEITLAVDADGNVTITNTIAMEQTNYWGEKFTDFADFYIGVMPKSLYDTYGKDALREDFGSWDFETAAATQRSSGIWNIADLQNYEEGVYEKETIEFTIDQLASAFYPKYQFEIGSEYVLFISLDTEMINYTVIPVLDNAIFANYKKVLVSAEFVEGSATWNDFSFKFNLAGYQYYVVGLLSDAEVEEYMSYGEYASVEEFIAAYIGGYGLMSAGAVFAGDYLEQEIKATEFAQYSVSGSGPSVAPATSYHFFVYPFNAASEMEFYTHEVVAENLRYYGEFETAALVAGEFDPAAEYEVIEHVEDNISVEVTLSADVVSAYYTWFEESATDPVAAVDAVLNDVYGRFVQFDEYTTTIAAEKYGYYGLPNPIYLAIVAINANGEYVYVEKEFKYIEPEPIALVSWEYKGRNFDIDDNPETSGGDHVYVGKTAEGEEITIGLYYTYADENGVITEGTYDYCANYFDAMYSYWNGFSIISDTTYYGSSLIVTADTIKIKIKGGNIYLFDKNAVPFEPEVLVMDNVVRANFKNSKIQFFHQVDGANVYCAGFYNYDVVDTDKMLIPEGEYVVGYNFYAYGYSNVYDYVAKGYNYDFDEGGVMKVSEVNGAYHVEFSGTLNDGTAVVEFVYDGLIENLILPSEYKEPVALEFTPVRAEYDYKFDLWEYNEGDSEYAYWLYDENNNYIEVIARYNASTGWDYKYDIKYVAGDVECVATKVTTIQKPNTWNCGEGELYYSLAFSTDDYVYSYAGQLPSVEVNYLGSDATYAPGSENPGVGGGDDQPTEPEQPAEATELTVVSHAFGYTGSMETEVIFTEANGNQHLIDFRMAGIKAGTYNSDNNGIVLGFCRFMYGSSDFGGGVVFDSADATITDNGDTTFTFDVNFVAEKAAYHFTYTTPKEEVNEDVTTVQLVSKSAAETISYGKAWAFSDAEGNNSVKLFVDEYYSYDSAADFPKANEYTTWQSSPSYVMTGSHFSFVNNSLVVNGVTYANSAVEAATLTVVEATSVTITFTIEGNNYKFVYSI